MSIVPDRSSYYESDTQRAALAQLTLTRGLRPDRLRVRSRATMLALSRVIAEHAAATGLETLLIAAFQCFSVFVEQAAHYQMLTPRLEHAYLIGVPDTAPPNLPNTTFVPIEASWPLAHEWAMIGSGPAFGAALLARTSEECRPNRGAPAFCALTTTDPQTVAAAVAAFHRALGLPLPLIDPDPWALLQSTIALKRALAEQTRK
jgi:DICT domain-containing protein